MVSDGPGVYANNMECVWLIDAPGPITVVFTHFSTEAGSDLLKIFGGNGDDDTALCTLAQVENVENGLDEATINSAMNWLNSSSSGCHGCINECWPDSECAWGCTGTTRSFDGPALPESFTTSSTSLRIAFTSDVSLTYSGFELELFSRVPDGTWVPTGAPTASPTLAPESGAALAADPTTPVLPACRGARIGRLCSPCFADVPDGVLFECDPAESSEGCSPNGTFAWRCSSDCIHEECHVMLEGKGLRGPIPELGDVSCAQRITIVCVAPSLLWPLPVLLVFGL